MKKTLLIIALVILLVILVGTAYPTDSASSSPKQVYDAERVAFAPMKVYVGEFDETGKMNPVYHCTIWGKYRYNTNLRNGFVFGDEFGTYVSNGRCEGIANP